MKETEIFLQELKEAIQTQNRRDIDGLTRDPTFAKLSGQDLSEALMMSGPLMQDSELLPRFIIHPNFKDVTTEAFAKTMLLAISLPYGNELVALLNHSQLEKLSPRDIEEIIQAIFQFQDRRVVSDLRQTAKFRNLFDRHMGDMIFCAIRTQNVFWLDEILSDYRYKPFSAKAFPDLIRWALKRKEEAIIILAIRNHHFEPTSESFLRQELIDTFNNEMDPLAEKVVDELVNHPDLPNFSHLLLSWMLMMSIVYIDQELFDSFTKHKSYPEIPPNRLAELIVFAMSAEKSMVDKLANHPNFAKLNGAELGLLLETIKSDSKEIFPLLIKHPMFPQIPEDHFRRMQAMNATTTTEVFRNEFLKEPLFRKKYGEMLYETIRRNDCEFIAELLKDKVIQKMIVEQLQNYATTDSYFVSEYTIRDVLREIFLTRDQSLAKDLVENPLFEKRLPDLSAQSIQFDDEDLVESLILNPKSLKVFHDVIMHAQQIDRERIYNIFVNNPSFEKKSDVVKAEVRSWKAS